MLKVPTVVLILITCSLSARADGFNLLNAHTSAYGEGVVGRLLETEADAIGRNNTYRYEYQQTFSNGLGKAISGAPLGGYPETLGSPAPAGTMNYGFTFTKPNVYGEW